MLHTPTLAAPKVSIPFASQLQLIMGELNMASAFAPAQPTIHSQLTSARVSCCTRRQRYTGGRRVARADARAAEPDATTSTKVEVPKLSFSWTEQWYAVCAVVDVPEREPLAVTIFDIPLAVYRVRKGEYAVLADRCAHRLAPLSEGRVVLGRNGAAEVECAYHGWRYGDCGSCTKIPQVHGGARPPRSASVRSYTVVERLGMLWVWLGNTKADESRVPVPEFVNGLTAGVTFVRELPYGMETLLENVADEEHIHWAHHGVSAMYNRKNGGKGSYFDAHREDWGLKGTRGAYDGGFEPPCVVWYRFKVPILELACVMFIACPISVDRCRLLFLRVLKANSLPGRAFVGMQHIKPRWWEHIVPNTILDGDTVLLRVIERDMGDPPKWKTDTIPLATTSDNFVVQLRSWMDEYRDDMPYLRKRSQYSPSKEQLIERTLSHTSRCSSCSGAHKGFTRALAIVRVLINAMVAAVVMLAILSGGLRSKPFLPVIATLIVALVVLWRLQVMCKWFIAQFTSTDEARKLYLTS